MLAPAVADALAATPNMQRHRSRDDGELVQSLRERLRKAGARAPDEAMVKAALALARDYEPSFKPDKDFWLAYHVPAGGARTRVQGYKQRILDDELLHAAPEPAPHPYRTAIAAADASSSMPLPLPLPQARAPPSLEEQAEAVAAQISELEAEIAEAESSLRPLQRRLRYINHQRMLAAWQLHCPVVRAVVTSSNEENGSARGSHEVPVITTTSSAGSLASEEEAVHAQIDALNDRRRSPSASPSRFRQDQSALLSYAGEGASTAALLYALK